MSAPNFSFKNTNDVYVVNDFNNNDVDLFQESVRSLLRDNKSVSIRDIMEWDDDRNYPMLAFSQVGKEFVFCGIPVTVTAEIGLRSGYYQAQNLDFNLKVECELFDGYKYERNNRSYYGYKSPIELAENFADDLQGHDYSLKMYYSVNNGLYAMNKGRLAKRIAAEIDGMMGLADGLCKRMCDDVYACLGVFSNGEAVYERV